MREFDYAKKWQALLTPEIFAMLMQIHEYRGEQNLFVEAQHDTLTQLLEIAKIQSTEASNKIEGIYTSEERLKKIVINKTIPQNRDEQEIAGYRDVLGTIHESYDFMPVKPTIILQMHKDLYRFSGKGYAGIYKTSDNIISEVDADGNKSVRFMPLSAWETPEAIKQICTAFDEALHSENVDPLLIIPMFILDFLSIHPFNDGNGRMSRLLTLLLLYREGYIVGKYISIEKVIENTKDTYYEALQNSSAGWHEGENDYSFFVKYILGVILSAYRDFSTRVRTLASNGLSKPDKIREIIKETLGTITKTEIMERCPDISQVTVQRTLKELLQTGEIIKNGGGRYTTYTWNRENE
ncbi:MAG: Fic family protein [Ruminococcaceae bacterium]|nr:Fic family protein [Oscillospiraceae bacterium]